MRPRILLTGKTGQIGTELSHLLPQVGQVIALDRQELDLLRPEEIRRVIQHHRPQIIVNTAAYTAVDQAEREAQTAQAINADAPGVMAQEAKKIGAVLIHYSTDYVFDGSKGSPYEETDPTNPINIYGMTKLAGERAIQAVGLPHLILRTAWIYAARGRNFLLTILRLATQREELRMVRDQVGAPTWSREIALATAQIIIQFKERELDRSTFSRLSGTYHMTAAGETNWYNFAKAILDEASRMPRDIPWFTAATGGRPLIARCVIPIAADEYPTPARRPVYSVLSNARVSRAFGIQLPGWQEQLRRMFQESSMSDSQPHDVGALESWSLRCF